MCSGGARTPPDPDCLKIEMRRGARTPIQCITACDWTFKHSAKGRRKSWLETLQVLMFNVDGKLSKCLNKCLMLIDGGAGQSTNVELLIEPSRLQMLKCWSPLGTKSPKMWKFGRFHVISRDFTWFHVWYWAHVSPKMVAPPSRSPNVDQHLSGLQMLINICWTFVDQHLGHPYQALQMLNKCLMLISSFTSPIVWSTCSTLSTTLNWRIAARRLPSSKYEKRFARARS